MLKDATLLGFRIPHHLCDGESVYHVIQAYRHIVSGQQIKTLVPAPDVETPLSEVLEMESKVPLPAGTELEGVPYLKPEEKLRVGVVPWVKYVGYAVGKMLGAKLGVSERAKEKLIHLPGKVVERWRSECQKELEQVHTSNKIPTISKLDVITAWFLQVSIQNAYLVLGRLISTDGNVPRPS